MRQQSMILAMLLAAATPAEALPSCSLGQRVMTPGGTPATVVGVRGSGCTVRKDGVTYTEVYAASMLAALAAADVPADLPPAEGVELGPAAYKCYYLAGTALNYSFIDIIIIDAGSYADRTGNHGQYHRAGRDIVFDSGPFAGNPAYAERGNVYLTAPGGGFYMSCSPG